MSEDDKTQKPEAGSGRKATIPPQQEILDVDLGRPNTAAGSRGGGGGASSSEPSPRQEQILQAYAANPIAAAVARALQVNERHVRRIVKKFPTQLNDIRQERHRERRERAEAREAKVHQWADDSIEQCLRQLDALAESTNQAVAIRALSMKLDLIRRMPPVVSTSIDLIEEFDRGLTVLLRDAVSAEDQAPQGELDHG